MEEQKDIVIFEQDATLAELIQNYLHDISDKLNISVFDKEKEGLLFCAQANVDVIFYDMEISSDASKDFVEKLEAVKPNCKIITLAYKYDSQTVFQLMRSGVIECLLKPVLKDNLIKAYESAVTPYNPEEDEAKVISVFSNKGGLGKTSVAVNLALSLSSFTKKRTMILDLNFQLGDVATFLDISPKFSISDILGKIEAQENADILSLTEKYKDSDVYVIADNYRGEYKENIPSERINKLLSVLKKHFGYIIVDLSQNLDNITQNVLNFSNLVLLVTNINLPSLRNTQRCLDLLKLHNVEEAKIQPVVNRYIDNDEITLTDVQKMLNKKVFCTIPNNYIAQLQAINKGVGVAEMNSNSNITKSYNELAKSIVKISE